MKHTILAPLLMVLTIAVSVASAEDAFQGHPRLQSAYTKLTGALERLEKRRISPSAQPTTAILTDLAAAKNFVADSGDNKAYRKTVIGLIGDATKELEHSPVDQKQIQTATEIVRHALEELKRAARAH